MTIRKKKSDIIKQNLGSLKSAKKARVESASDKSEGSELEKLKEKYETHRVTLAYPPEVYKELKTRALDKGTTFRKVVLNIIMKALGYPDEEIKNYYPQEKEYLRRKKELEKESGE